MAYPWQTYPTFARNDVQNLPAPPGGMHVRGEGGSLIVSPVLYGTSTPVMLFDVEAWKVAGSCGEAPFAKGGMMGATSSRRTGYSYVWEADVVIDLRVQPWLELRRRLEVELLFRWGEPSVQASAGVSIMWRYWWLPRAHVDQCSGGLAMKEAGRQHLSGVASSHMLLLPEEGDPGDSTTRAGAYLAWLQTNWQ